MPGEQADALAGPLGMLPLALAQAAAYIRNADITIGRYLDLLATRLLREVVPELGHLTDDHQRIITATWELSIDQASRATPVGLARPLLQLASVLDPAGIPQQALSSAPAIAYLASALAAAAPGPGVEAVDEAMVDEALRVLHRYSLANHDRAARYREIRVHQLVQRAARENLTTQPGQQGPAPLTALASAAAGALEAVWPQAERDELGQVLRANATALQQGAGPALWNHDKSGQGVLFRSATSLGETGQVAAARDAYAALYRTALRHLGPDHPDTLATRHSLARWRGEAGDAAGAATETEELLADRLRVLGPDHPGTLTTRHNLARWRGRLVWGKPRTVPKSLVSGTAAFPPGTPSSGGQCEDTPVHGIMGGVHGPVDVVVFQRQDDVRTKMDRQGISDESGPRGSPWCSGCRAGTVVNKLRPARATGMSREHHGVSRSPARANPAAVRNRVGVALSAAGLRDDEVTAVGPRAAGVREQRCGLLAPRWPAARWPG